jgi:hypothetical protein
LAEDQIRTFAALFPWAPPSSVYLCAGLADVASLESDQESSQLAAARWFARLGGVIATRGRWTDSSLDEATALAVLRKATGVVLMRGSVAVTG